MTDVAQLRHAFINTWTGPGTCLNRTNFAAALDALLAAEREACAAMLESVKVYTDPDGVRWEHLGTVQTECSKWGCTDMAHLAAALRGRKG